MGSAASSWQVFPHLIVTITHEVLRSPHCAHEEAEAQRGSVTDPRSQPVSGERGLETRLSGSHIQTLNLGQRFSTCVPLKSSNSFTCIMR